MSPRVVLTGFMGAGKTTVGRALATALGVEFIDADAELERRTGRSIPQIFAVDGEEGFRQIELATVVDVLATHDGVVALGGGAVTVPAIAAALAGHHVVYLQIGPEAGYARVAGSNRPLLAGPEPANRYRDLLAGRADAYAAVAACVVDAAAPPDNVVAAILARLPDAAGSESRAESQAAASSGAADTDTVQPNRTVR